MEGAIIGLVIAVLVLAGLVVFLLMRSPGRPTSQPQSRNRGTTDPATLRQEQIAAAQRRSAEAEARATHQENMLMHEEDTEYYRQVERETRDARSQRRQPSKGKQS